SFALSPCLHNSRGCGYATCCDAGMQNQTSGGRERRTKMKPHLLALSLIALLLATSPSVFATTFLFSDGTFNDGDWNVTTFFYQGASGGVTASQNGSGGNPGAFRSVTNNV